MTIADALSATVSLMKPAVWAPYAFHPHVERWFTSHFEGPTDVQRLGWAEIATNRNVLLAAPTGSGKTLAAFLFSIHRLVSLAADKALEDRTYVIYVSPLKALSNDIEKNLRGPLAEIEAIAKESDEPFSPIRIAVRTGDTPSRERQLQLKRPPHILITTPESLYVLLTAEKSRAMLAHADTVIVDEIHAVAGDKRGAHLALSLERLDLLAGKKLQRIGLSATQKPIDLVARLLVGSSRTETDGKLACAIVDQGHKRELKLSVEVPDHELVHVASHEMRNEIYDRIAELVAQHRTTIVFVNTRRLVERVSHSLGERIGHDKVAAHHGSLSREARFKSEQALKRGDIPVMIATASLELGIDIGHVDLVLHLGAPRSLSSLLQRVGRSGHFLGGTPKGILFPLTRDDLVQSVAAVRSIFRGELDHLVVPDGPLDILAQQIVATVSSQEMDVDGLYEQVLHAFPYRGMRRAVFDAVIEMLSEGISTRRGRRSALVHFDRVNGKLRGRRGARLAAMTGGGAIPDMADYEVVKDPEGAMIGKVHEDFAIESMAGDVFLLGNHAWRIRRVEAGRLRVEDASGRSPTIPFWIGEAPARTMELSASVAALRQDIVNKIDELGVGAATAWLVEEGHLVRPGAEQLVRYVDESRRVLGAIPTQKRVVAERFFDEAGGMQLVLHTPFGGRINRALGLALRKRFCVSFDFELQAAATDDGVVLSLGEAHSFPLENVFAMLKPNRVREDLIQAVLASPMFTNRWRWNATRALAISRRNGGKRVPIALQRMRAEDLMAAVFPEQIACGDNHAGPIEVPDHPLVNETIENCLHEAMDLDGFVNVLHQIDNGEIETVAIETSGPSALSHEILNANPYAFLDDAPLEERRARAVSLRRMDPDLAAGIGALDPAAIAEVRRQAWPDVRDPDEVHDALLSLGLVPIAYVDAWAAHLDALRDANRIRTIERGGRPFIVAAERFEKVQEIDYLPTIIRGWMESMGPTTASFLANLLEFAEGDVEAALIRLESTGNVMRGRYTSKSNDEIEWCERGLLARIHRLTIGRLRSEIEPVSQADFMRFLFRWQHVAAGTKLHGKRGVAHVIEQLQGLELPGPAWETSVLPARIENYDPADLEQLCLSGEVMWGRLWMGSAPREDEARGRRRPAPTRSAPLAFVLRESLPDLLDLIPALDDWIATLSPRAREVYEVLGARGASFLADIARHLKALPMQVEEALWELVATGLVAGDGVAGLRTLLLPEQKRQPKPRALRAVNPAKRLMPLGRWSQLRNVSGDSTNTDADVLATAQAKRLLGRYGVLFRELCAREKVRVSWRALLVALRRLEARGEIRGGRFVTSFVGEQFALPEAVEALRASRRDKSSDEATIIAASDPLNFVGIITPGDRISPLSTDVIAYRNGVPVEVGPLGEVRSRLQMRTQVV